MRMLTILALLLSTGCKYEEVTTETGYKGKARVDPWLAAERFTERLGRGVTASGSWKNPEEGRDAVCFVPAALLSNESFVRRMGNWVEDGGHLVLLVEHADAEWNDWNAPVQHTVRLEPALLELLREAGCELETDGPRVNQVSEISFLKKKYPVDAGAWGSVHEPGGKPGVFLSRGHGAGRISVVMDARIFRSRWIGEHGHAALLRALIEAGEESGRVMFIRGSGMSLWAMLSRHLWPVLTGLGLLVAVWLWKNFSRFGPLEPAAAPSLLRGYDHHLEALGDFQWRLDRCAALLAPLRERLVENGQKLALKTGRRDGDFFQLLADRGGISRDRVQRALTETMPNDSGILARTAADLQRLLEAVR